jgi:hypothetical protein
VVGVGVVPSYAVLALVQGALVLAPGGRRRLGSSRAFGLAVPAGALVVGVAIAREAGGAGILTALAAFATPLLAAAAGWARGWRRPVLPALAAPALYLLAWLRPGTLAGEAAGVALIAGACLAVTGALAASAPERWLVVGLVMLVLADLVLVWGEPQVGPAMNALSAARPPALGRPLPALQQVQLGSVTMGWLDLAAPALLGLLAHRRARAAAATAVAAGAWGLLLVVTSPIAATPPVLAGLAAGRAPRRRSPTRTRPVGAGRGPTPCAGATAPPLLEQATLPPGS